MRSVTADALGTDSIFGSLTRKAEVDCLRHHSRVFPRRLGIGMPVGDSDGREELPAREIRSRRSARGRRKDGVSLR